MIRIIDAAELYEPDTINHKIMEWLGYLASVNVKIVSGPVEDVPVEFDKFWIVGFKDGIYYWITSLGEDELDRIAVRKQLLKEIDKLPAPRINERTFEAHLMAHRLIDQEIVAGLQMGRRVSDGIAVTLLCFSPALSLEEAYHLMSLVAKSNRKKHYDD